MLFYKFNKYKIIMEEKSDINFNIVLLGKAGSGKGTQAKFLEKEYNLHHISIGDVMRRHVKENTKLGELIKQCQEKGELVPDDTTIEILKKEIELIKSQNKNLNGFIFDGFPRTPEQAQLLDQIINLEETIAVNFDISDEMAIKRIQKRAQLDGDNARKDDLSADAIQERLDIYYNNYSGIKTFLEKELTEDKFIEIDVEEKNEKQVFKELYKKLAEQDARLEIQIERLKKLDKQFESTKLNKATAETNDLKKQHILQ